jgi:hypothetical protein
LKNVPADSRSLFDPESASIDYIELEDPPVHGSQSSDHTKRKNSQTKEPFPEFNPSKRLRQIPSPIKGEWGRKKHPSPNRLLLMDLERQIESDPNFPKNDKAESTAIVNSKRVGGILIHKDSNAKLSSSVSTNILGARSIEGKQLGKDIMGKSLEPDKRRERAAGGLESKSGLTRTTTTSFDMIGKLQKPSETLIPTPQISQPTTQQPRRQTAIDEDSRMDIDELQWDIAPLMGGTNHR